jgi:hypothetical protein
MLTKKDIIFIVGVFRKAWSTRPSKTEKKKTAVRPRRDFQPRQAEEKEPYFKRAIGNRGKRGAP